MLLQKTGLRIKQFISHRRKSSIEESGDNLQYRFTDTKTSKESFADNSKRASWLSQIPSPEFQAGRSASCNATTRSRLSPPISATAHSSASSLCSCDCAQNLVSIHSLSGAVPQRLEPRPEILYLPFLSSKPSSSDAKTWRLVLSEGVSQPSALVTPRLGSKRYSESSIMRDSTFDLLEALAIIPSDDDSTPTQSIRNTETSDMDSVSENVEQLIRETDQAFQAVGHALADVKAVTQDCFRDVLGKQPKPPVAPLKPPISKTKSVSKGSRKTFYRNKTGLPGRAPHDAPPPTANTTTRWTLTDVTTNMADVFSGKMFRTEVDEMLTPSRIQRLRDGVKIETERKLSLESACSVDTYGSTPTEPFHLENLSSRISAAQLKQTNLTPFPSAVLPPPATPERGHCPGKKDKATNVKPAEVPVCMAYKDLNFPSPPHLSGSNTRCTPPLPTIPEVSPIYLTTLKSFDASCSYHPNSSAPNKNLQNYLLLPSTSFTLTLPLFRHGPIRLERKQKEPLLEEESLDWTAFQMAISGTMNETDLDERDDLELAADEAVLDEIMEWWAGFGIQSIGSMVQDTPRRGSRISDVKDSNIMKRSGKCDTGTDKIVVEHDIPAAPVRWMKREYSESLPPSPMLDLVPPSPSNDEEVIPMGFNLGHDLGDFLNWEAKHVQKYFIDD